MKKNLHFLFSFLLFPCFLFSQSHSVNHSIETYTPLTGANLLDETGATLVGASDLYKAIPIGFTFELLGNMYDSLNVGELGFVSFGGDDFVETYISVFNCFLKDFNDTPSESPIYYETSGLVGDRVFKCQFTKKGFQFDSENNDFVNVQLWIYESCNDFEVRFGETSIEPTEIDSYFSGHQCATIGFGKTSPSNTFFLIGAPNTPSIIEDDDTNALDSEPSDGMLYTFSNCTLGSSETSLSQYNIYPNPANDQVNIKLKELAGFNEIRLLNGLGQTVKSQKVLNTNQITLDLTNYKSGVYSVQLIHADVIVTKKLIVK